MGRIYEQACKVEISSSFFTLRWWRAQRTTKLILKFSSIKAKKVKFQEWGERPCYSGDKREFRCWNREQKANCWRKSFQESVRGKNWLRNSDPKGQQFIFPQPILLDPLNTSEVCFLLHITVLRISVFLPMFATFVFKNTSDNIFLYFVFVLAADNGIIASLHYSGN